MSARHPYSDGLTNVERTRRISVTLHQLAATRLAAGSVKPAITAVARLRAQSGAGALDCRNALIAGDGNTDAAIELLRVKRA